MDQVAPSRAVPARFLFAMFQGGGNIPLILPIAARLVARGHAVRILAGLGVRVAPGQMALAVIPCAAPSSAAARVRPISPCLAAM